MQKIILKLFENIAKLHNNFRYCYVLMAYYARQLNPLHDCTGLCILIKVVDMLIAYPDLLVATLGQIMFGISLVGGQAENILNQIKN